MTQAGLSDAPINRTEDWWRFLVEASTLLGSSLDVEQTTQDLANLAVPALADWCAVHLRADAQMEEVIAIAHRRPEALAALREFRERFAQDSSAEVGIPEVLRTGNASLYDVVTDEMLAAQAQNPEHLDLMRAVGICSVMILPIRSRDRILGSLMFGCGDSGRHYASADVERATQLATRAGLALENARMYLRAQREGERRQRFVSIASHELRTPLTSIIGYAQRLGRRADDGVYDLPTEVAEGLAIISSESQRMHTILEQMLDMARLATPRFELELEPVDLREVAKSEAELLRARWPDALVTCDLSAEPLFASVDVTRLRQVVANLLENAAKYGGDPPEIRIGTARRGRFVELRVQDNGTGIAPADRELIFEAFEQGDDGAGRGLGVGLWLARQFTERMGGRLLLDEGASHTEFAISLPAAPASEADSANGAT